MKKIILVALITVMISPTCFAQDVEPEGIFSVEVTFWRMCGIHLTLNPRTSSSPLSLFMNCNQTIGFHPQNDPIYYYELAVVSIAWIAYRAFYYYLAIMQPTIGFGAHCSLSYFQYVIGIMYKTDDKWSQTYCVVLPYEGYQGTTLRDVTMRGENTYFESGVVDITFIPSDGMTISNIRTIQLLSAT